MLVLAVVASSPTALSAPSFDCAATTNRAEKLICSDAELSQLDRLLDVEYKKVIAISESPDRMRKEQHRWLARRNACSSRKCIERAYETRIGELQLADCARDLATGTCAQEAVFRLSRTADGRLLLRTKEECRSGSNEPYDGTIRFGGQGEAINIQADCIEAGIYDPCEDALGTWGMAQCAWANMEVAERRIRRTERALPQLPGFDAKQVSDALASSSDQWRARRATYCRQRDIQHSKAQAQEIEAAKAPDPGELVQEPPDSGDGDEGEILGYCLRRITEERAQNLEYFLTKMKASNSRLERTRFFKYLEGDPFARAAQPER